MDNVNDRHYVGEDAEIEESQPSIEELNSKVNEMELADAQKFATAYQRLVQAHGYEVIGVPIYYPSVNGRFELGIEYTTRKVK